MVRRFLFNRFEQILKFIQKFLEIHLLNSRKKNNFATREPAKPLNDA